MNMLRRKIIDATGTSQDIMKLETNNDLQKVPIIMHQLALWINNIVLKGSHLMHQLVWEAN